MSINWPQLLTITSGMLAIVIAIWKIFYPMYLRSVKLELIVYDCWYVKLHHTKGEASIRIKAFVSVEQQRGEDVQILRFRWRAQEEKGGGTLTMGKAVTDDGSGIKYTLYLSSGKLTKRDLEWDVAQESQVFLDDGSIPGEITVETTRDKKAKVKCRAAPKPPKWALWR